MSLIQHQGGRRVDTRTDELPMTRPGFDLPLPTSMEIDDGSTALTEFAAAICQTVALAMAIFIVSGLAGYLFQRLLRG